MASCGCWSRCPLVLCMRVCAVRSVQTFACALCISLDVRGAVRGEQFCLGGVFACVVEQWACVVFIRVQVFGEVGVAVILCMSAS